MAGNRALHWAHKLYQPSHIAMDTKKFFMLQKLNEWTIRYLHDLINVELHLFILKHFFVLLLMKITNEESFGL